MYASHVSKQLLLPLRVRWRLFALYYRRASVLGIRATLRALLRPTRVSFHARRVIHGDTRSWGNFYVPSTSIADEVRFCCQVTGQPVNSVESALAELEQDDAAIGDLAERYNRERPDSPVPFHLGRLKLWYAIVRLVQPILVMETGVHDGLSSALILHAMARNGRGTLVSIDLPSVELPITVEGPGWLVPNELRSRWRLHIGNSRDLLPILAKRYAPIDMFIHDSDHNREFQRFEYNTVKPFLRNSGFLLTDDAHVDLFLELARAWVTPCYFVRGGEIASNDYGLILGGLRLSERG